MSATDFRPSDSRIEQIMRETGMGRIQARNHEQQRLYLLARANSGRFNGLFI